ncbi:bifunctional tRNA (5-methylaminomethyl-2-thiouridine)(34)-methyltransferase MnmD/FAD-dependent 5-carboxymethylaminomethyl-2-thiouridine(34) oxidoreductase MnmC [Terasakiella pusilla]|uniref:bifunctional tRNA (5-methylaminomethyl-2-thiouridine)(34)-methyltransferase MnmD/FAD-dependent 5-carboxymethylaminomethyl-2-thiouridine(34) oxidoreductase MnmC n=1 Tax=Terasakiella pusilla TaxID=64973 RepID=UPI00048C7612|nr:bifunctional tRNA (5-methylaminomethyl-2-thiouridine)(34)-methyltransferase MnmD/FAD-dependent 5-carboxymethylaminomethyl-2-thiouridine(34) oxidoreductase MnmC [Terasakiella pusilla]
MSELSSPELSWKDEKTPVSGRFDDVYFSADDGLAESMYVFVNGCGLPERLTGQTDFTVAETGFGTGLNFLLTLKAWKESDQACRLHYLSVEAFPLTPDQLRAAYKTFEGLEEEAEELLSVYPDLTHGFHHVVLQGGKVKLTLMFGDAAAMFADLDARVDAWYLDGFAPAKNPEMWCPEVFHEIGRLAHRDCILSTFTAAGFVKRGLAEVGFSMTKRRGFGRKRESLIGTFEGEDLKVKAPWYQRYATDGCQKKIAVIGAGVAGMCAALRLQADGHEVKVFERNSHAGSEGSGNRIGLLKPKLFLSQEGIGRFNTIAYLHALRFYDRYPETPWHGARGIFQMMKEDADEDRFKDMIARNILPDGDLLFLTRQDASNRLGMDVPKGGLWFTKAGCIEPSQLCQTIASTLEVTFDCTISKIEKTDHWRLYDEQGLVFEGDCVVLATAGENAALNSYSDLAMNGRRGQVSYIETTANTAQLDHAVSYGGYMLPAREGEHVLGASFEKWPDLFDHAYEDLSDESHAFNLKTLSSVMDTDGLVVKGGRASIRAMTTDHQPIVGPVYDHEWYMDTYGPLRHGPKRRTFAPAEYVGGLYTLCGLGARGVQTAPLLADILSSYINGTPCPIENKIREALHPARFLMRDIIRGKK